MRTATKNKAFGLPYKGSKNGIAKDIVRVLPKAKHFYDLFAGGCSVTHVAMLSGKYNDFIINDLSLMPELFYNAVQGKYAHESRWISREDFERLKDTDPYVETVWSFGNNGKCYLYSKETEPLKRALHECHFASNERERKEAMNRYRKLVKGQRMELQSLEALQRLQSLERLQRLQSDYREVTIEKNSIIYCDPPYRNTSGYQDEAFDHEAFYEWCNMQTEPLFISEYDMPQDSFVCVAEFRKPSLLHNGHYERKYVTEKLYRPRKQIVG